MKLTKDTYLGEPVCVSGMWTTRGSVICEMQDEGFDHKLIDRWLQGFDHYWRTQGHFHLARP